MSKKNIIKLMQWFNYNTPEAHATHNESLHPDAIIYHTHEYCDVKLKKFSEDILLDTNIVYFGSDNKKKNRPYIRIEIGMGRFSNVKLKDIENELKKNKETYY